MLAEIITIGDEILIGQIIDSNSAFLGKELNKIGIDVHQISSIRDDKNHILTAFEEAKSRVDLVLITGGLGPTKDDITKHTICEYFEDTLVQNDTVLAHIKELFEKYVKAPMSDLNILQAQVPSKAQVLMNQYGTAPGMWLEKDGVVFVSMPGVPYEMKNLMKNEVLPKLIQDFDRPYIVHKTLITYGLGESALADKIEDWENSLPEFIKLAYLPNLGRVRLRLTGKGSDKSLLIETIEKKFDELHQIIGDIIVGYEGEGGIASQIGALLTANGSTLAVAESCTGGRISELFTEKEGASQFFNGGVVVYSTASKINILGVDQDLISQFTVTSAEVAEDMAIKAKEKFNTDYAISTTGNAGPAKGEGDAEVGTVFIGVATPERVFSKKFVFSNNRTKTIGKAVNKSLELLFQELRN